MKKSYLNKIERKFDYQNKSIMIIRIKVKITHNRGSKVHKLSIKKIYFFTQIQKNSKKKFMVWSQ